MGKDFWNDLTSTQKAGLVVGALIIVALAAVVITRTLNEPYAVLFSELEDKDAGRVITQLESMKRSYKLGDSGSSILVPASEVHDVLLTFQESFRDWSKRQIVPGAYVLDRRGNRIDRSNGG